MRPALPAAVLLAALTVAPDPAAAQMNILGPCREGYRWMATTTSGAPIAAYATCDAGTPLIIVACGSGGPELRIAVAPGATVPTPGQQVMGTLTIDTQTLEVRLAPGTYNAQGVPVIRAQLTGPVVQAMAAGFRATLDAMGTRVEMHLGASGEVLALFNRQC